MIGVRFKWCAVVLGIVVVGVSVRGEEARTEQQGKPVTTVRVQDIPKKVQLIGRLEHPLGSLLTIRGEWRMPKGLKKNPLLMFHVERINGKKPKENIVLHSWVVKPFFKNSGRGPKPGEVWDWRFDWGGKLSSPAPVEGETWEMRGVETGSFGSRSEEAMREIGQEDMQLPICLTGFVTYFEFVAVKKIQK